MKHFWRIFQVIICDLECVVKVVNFHKKTIWAQRPKFFQIFLSDSDFSSHFTLSLNWFWNNMPRNKKIWINRPNFGIPITAEHKKSLEKSIKKIFLTGKIVWNEIFFPIRYFQKMKYVSILQQEQYANRLVVKINVLVDY